MTDRQHASAGHKLGQLVGDWFEEFCVLPLLEAVAAQLHLYLDHRFRTRAARVGDKILWRDVEGNDVDYDFVMELVGSDEQLGVPVAFVECFWRRGARHSKDKARDDTGKLLPMRNVYPTARFLGIVAAGDFTAPARTLVQNRHIDLFYIPKAKVVSAFGTHGLEMDYPDRLPEPDKAKLAEAFEHGLTAEVKQKVATTLQQLVGAISLGSYLDRVRAALGALPQEIRILAQRRSRPEVFETIAQATAFLQNPQFDFSDPAETFIYEITYTDGTEFERPLEALNDVRKLHQQMERLATHMGSLKSSSG